MSGRSLRYVVPKLNTVLIYLVITMQFPHVVAEGIAHAPAVQFC